MSKEKISFINIITCRCVFLLILQPCHFESACVVADSQSVSCRVFTCFKRICVKVAYVRQRGTWPLAPPLPLAFPLTVERDQRTWRPQCVASCGRESNRRVAPPPFRPPSSTVSSATALAPPLWPRPLLSFPASLITDAIVAGNVEGRGRFGKGGPVYPRNVNSARPITNRCSRRVLREGTWINVFRVILSRQVIDWRTKNKNQKDWEIGPSNRWFSTFTSSKYSCKLFKVRLTSLGFDILCDLLVKYEMILF